MTCPCGSGDDEADCCGPVLAGAAAPTAVALMRSRFTAFVRGDVAHLERTWASETRPPDVRIDPRRRWTALEVTRTERGRALDTEGVVAFVAHWEQDGRRGSLRETSRFRRERGRWVYVDGI